MATIEDIKNKYQGDAVAAKLAPPSKIPSDIAMSALHDLKSGKGNKPIPKDFVLLVAQNAYDWASKDKKFVDEWNTADHMGKVRLFKRYSAEYVKKFKYAIANGMKQRGLLDSVDQIREKYQNDAPH